MHAPTDVARHRAHMPTGTNRFLNVRSLTDNFRRLAELLQPGMSVLDVGCGSGAITRGIAEAVGPDGRVVGLDINARLIAEARATHGDVPGLSFEVGDIDSLPFTADFDIVTAARVLQWLAQPADALRHMVAATRPSGRVVVLDYNHEKIDWQPEPPPSMRTFYNAFLRWRADAGMDNAMADHLGALFAANGLQDVVVTPQHEMTRRGDADFEQQIDLWAGVIATRGHQVVADGALSEVERALAEQEFRAWGRSEAQSQTLYLLAIEGVRPN